MKTNSFTAVECAISMMIIAIMAAIIIPGFINAKNKAQAQACSAKKVTAEDYKVEKLFEKDGVSVYRFFIPNDGWRYFSAPIQAPTILEKPENKKE
jgi:hypothetical protein